MNIKKMRQTKTSGWGGERGNSQPSRGLFKLMPWLGTPIWKDKPQSHSNVVFGTLAHFGFQMLRLGLLLNPSSMRMFQDLKTLKSETSLCPSIQIRDTQPMLFCLVFQFSPLMVRFPCFDLQNFDCDVLNVLQLRIFHCFVLFLELSEHLESLS